MNFRWPSGPGNNLNPWYVIAWRALWLPVIAVGLAVATVGLAIGAAGFVVGGWKRQE